MHVAALHGGVVVHSKLLQGYTRDISATHRLFARMVLASSQPGALLITGDLVDGKTLLGRGQQIEEEWQVIIQMLNW